jgi:hypothetical protein
MSRDLFRLMILYVDGAKQWWPPFIEKCKDPVIVKYKDILLHAVDKPKEFYQIVPTHPLKKQPEQ